MAGIVKISMIIERGIRTGATKTAKKNFRMC
jgi:hypothetical protein